MMMMKKMKFVAVVAAAAAFCVAGLNVQAEAKTAAKSAPASANPAASPAASPAAATGKTESQPSSARPIPFYGKISTVDKANKSFTITGLKTTRTFTATEATKMQKGDGIAATWDDLKSGEYVRGSAMKKAEGQYEAVSVKIGQKEKTASTKPKK